MKKAMLFIVISMLILTTSSGLLLNDDSSADNSISVTPGTNSTSATLTYISSGTLTNSSTTYPYINWQLDITTPRELTWGAEIYPMETKMGSIASSYGFSSTSFKKVDNTYSHQNNSSLSSAGFSANYYLNYNPVRIKVSGNGINTVGDTTFTNDYVNDYLTTRWYVVTTDDDFNNRVYNFITIVAHTTADVYTVTLDANGGTVNPGSITVTQGATYGTLPTPTRSGYSFNGWFTASTGGTQVTSSTVCTENSDHTLYAHWIEGVTVTPTQNSTSAILTYVSSGTLTNDLSTYPYINWQLDITTPRELTWGAKMQYLEQSMGVIASSYGFSSTSFEIVNNSYSHQNNTSLTSNGFNVSYYSGTNPDKIDVYGNGINTVGDTTFTNDYVNDYLTTRWYVVTADSNYANMVYNFITIVIHTTQRNYEITYDLDDGTWINQPTTSFVEGTVVTLPTYTDLIKSGYTFTGWRDTNDQIVSQVTMNSDYTLTAVWDWNYRILTYNTNGGTWNTEPQTVIPKNTTITLSTDISRMGYTFSNWEYNNSTVTTITMDADKTVNAIWQGNPYTVYFNANGGTVDTSSKTVTYGSQYGELPLPEYIRYVFDGWFTDPDNGSLVTENSTYSTLGDQTLYAHWTENVTYWSNGNPNGSVSILYHIDNKNVTNDLITRYRLYRYDETIPDDPNTEVIESFVLTGYYLWVEVNSVKVGSTNDITVMVGLYDSNNTLIASNIYDFGSWGSFIITVDTVNATVGYTKVMQFRTFTDYQESVSGTILSYGSYGSFTGQVTEVLEIIPVTTTVPRQQVVKTSVFLNTYGVVLRNPSLDIGTYFPDMTNMRLNFYSFALYGDSVTINGHTMNVTAPNLTVYYTSDANGNHIADSPGTGVNEKSVELTNIYITWDGSRCSLTFANDSLTIDMGTYTDKTVSFSGMWYFASALYEPYTAQETSYDVDWYTSFDLSTFGIVLAGLLILGAIVCKATIGGRALDYVIIICGTLVALVIAGGLINA